LNLSETGNADSDETHRQPRGAMPRVMASVIVAFFAYLGLALGGGFGTLTSTETNNFSAAKGSQQPHYLTVRDTSRGVVVAERDVEPKASWHDGGAALLASPVFVPFSYSAAAPLGLAAGLPAKLKNGGAYLARGPPAVFA
jgi:hypothetical protein